MVRLNLQIKLLALMSLVIVLLLVILMTITISTQRQISQDSLKTRAIILAQALDAGITTHEELSDTEKLRSNIYKSIWLNPDILKIDIALPTDEGMKIIASNEVGIIGTLAEQENNDSFEKGLVLTRTLSQPDGSHILSVITPVHIGGQRVGTYNIRLSLETEEENIAQQQRRFIFMIFITIVSIIIVLSVAIGKIVITPILEIGKGLEEIGKGDLNWRIIPKGEDEIGDLALGINRMAEELKESHSTLEKKVKERTKELDRIAKLLIRRDLELSEMREKREKELGELAKTAKILIRRDLALSEANERLIAMDKAKSEFISIAAHQLRTPLSGVKWNLRMVIDEDMGKITKEQKEFLERGYQTNERMIHLVTDLLDVTRIEEGRFAYQFSYYHLEDLIEEILKDYKHSLKEKGITLKFLRSREGLPKVKIDLEKMRLALENILDNARTYTPKGGEIKISLRRVNGNLLTTIADTGVGIPREQMNRLFTKFFRGSNIVSMETEGTGIGLFITKNIIEKHGGRIWAESEEGKGSKFYFTMPI